MDARMPRRRGVMLLIVCERPSIGQRFAVTDTAAAGAKTRVVKSLINLADNQPQQQQVYGVQSLSGTCTARSRRQTLPLSHCRRASKHSSQFVLALQPRRPTFHTLCLSVWSSVLASYAAVPSLCLSVCSVRPSNSTMSVEKKAKSVQTFSRQWAHGRLAYAPVVRLKRVGRPRRRR